MGENPAAPDDWVEWLGHDEVARLEGLLRLEDRAMFLASHGLLRAAVQDVTGASPADMEVSQRCDRCGGPHGRPEIRIGGQPGPPVSLTHSGGWVAVTIAPRSVGIDLEPFARSGPDVASIALSDGERIELEGAAAEDRRTHLLRWWVRKEAVLKATGTGLRTDLRHVRVTPPWTAPAVIDPSEPIELRDVDVDPELAMSIAVRGTGDLEVTVSRWRW